MPAHMESPPVSREALNDDTQADLVTRIVAADAGAEGELVTLFQRPLFLMLLRRVGNGDVARDLVQDVFVAALPALRNRQLEQPHRLAAFIHGIARNLANDHLRRSSRTPTHLELVDESAWVDARHQFEATARLREVTSALAELADDDQRLLRLTLVDGQKPGEIATALGLSAEVVRTRKTRALKRLMQRLLPGGVTK